MQWVKLSSKLHISLFRIDKIKSSGYLPVPRGNKNQLIDWFMNFTNYSDFSWLMNKAESQVFAIARKHYEWYLDNVDINAKPSK